MKTLSIIFTMVLINLILGCSVSSHEMKSDPIESDPKFTKILEDVDLKIKQHPDAIEYGDRMGFCHVYWDLKKEILKNEYDINWKSPAELNPNICFD